MHMKVVVAQIFGIVVTLLCLISPHFQKKWQMLAVSVLSNLLAGLNFLLLGEISATGVAVVAVVQSLIGIWHTKKGSAVTLPEVLIFGIFYIVGGLLPTLMAGTLNTFAWRDILPILGALLYLGYVVQKKEQFMRAFLLANATVYVIYDALIGSTQIFAQIVTIISILIALLHYRKKELRFG